ncbi:carboxypeptidase-like regulatory domain-containing protein [Pedobacter sp.]
MSKRITLIMLGLLLFAVFAYAQNNVTGKVIDASTGSGIPGVSVSVKGQKANAVATGNDGSFSIRVPSNAVLVFSSIGYSTKEINVGSQSVINVQLSEDAKTLEGVVVTALGITREKKALAYSAQSVTSEEINFGNKQNMLNALQGKIAGATISSTGGAPGQ